MGGTDWKNVGGPGTTSPVEAHIVPDDNVIDPLSRPVLPEGHVVIQGGEKMGSVIACRWA